MALTAGSLFSGMGCFDLAYDRAGFDIKWQVEIRPSCQLVLRRHWPGIPLHKDINHVGRHNLAPVDVIFGGWPCQDLSVAGKRAGLAGARSGLFWEAARVVAELRPALVMLENVPGLLSSHAGRDFRAVLNALRELGARDIAWRTLDAQYAGVPQRRRRVFLVADFGGERAAEILFESQGSRGDFTPRREAGPRVAAPLTAGSASGRGVNPPGRRQEDDVNIVPTLTSHNPRYNGTDEARVPHLSLDVYQCQGSNVGPVGALRHGNGNETGGVPFVAFTNRGDDTGAIGETLLAASHGAVPMVSHALTGEGADASEDGSGRGTPIIAIQDAAMPREKRQNGIGISEDGPMYTLDQHGAHAVACRASSMLFDAQQLTSDVNRTRVEPGLPSSTLTSNSKMHAAGTYGVRRLMPIECERLQGLPDDWSQYGANGKELSDTARYLMIGNGGAVPVLEWIARRIAVTLSAGEECAS